MNITLSADKKLIETARKLAASRQTSLNGLIREYLKTLCATQEAQEAAAEFASLAIDHGGRSEDGFRFDREEAHRR